MGLPEAFTEKMKGLLGEEYGAFAASYETERVQGLRRNPLKAGEIEFLKKVPFHLEKIPWASEGYYYRQEERPGKHPFHEAGLYYIQEPSAMAVVELLDPVPGDCVLDLCAAPGGKTTQIAGRLMGEGFLLSNEIHPARAKILSQNVERMGAANVVVTSEEPGRLKKHFPEYFDKIVVDAPCSGEGMFRKDENARDEWSTEHVAMCADRQREILREAAAMLKPGGRLVYSTCTFSPEENEQTIEAFLEENREFSIEEGRALPGLDRGRPEWSKNGGKDLACTYRIWPHHTAGEGHYLAVLKKAEGLSAAGKLPSPDYVKDSALLKDFREMMGQVMRNPEKFLKRTEYCFFGDQLYLVPRQMPGFGGLRVVRAGLHMGTLKKNRFEPAHALAMHLRPEDVYLVWDMEAQGAEAVKYLKGETITPESGESRPDGAKGWVLMCVDGISTGFGKLAGGVLKNHYPRGLRWM